MAKKAGYKNNQQRRTYKNKRRDKEKTPSEEAPGRDITPQEHLYSHQENDGSYAYSRYKQNGYQSRRTSQRHHQRRSQNDFQRHQHRRDESSGNASPQHYQQMPQRNMTLYSPGFFQGYGGGGYSMYPYQDYSVVPQFTPPVNTYYGCNYSGNFILSHRPTPAHSRVASYQGPYQAPKAPFRLDPEAPEFVPASKILESITRQISEM